jgi:hypothetical protein
MKSFFETGIYDELTSRLNKLNNDTSATCGKIQYKHLDHHFREFGV